MEDLNWRRACFCCSGQHRQGKKKKKRPQKANSEHGLAIDEFLSFFTRELMEVGVSDDDDEDEYKDIAVPIIVQSRGIHH